MAKLALIIGASSGLGKEYARYHASKGGDAIIVARSEDKLNELKEELEKQYGVNVHIIVQDLGLYDAAETVYNQVNEMGLTVDYLINNAGLGGQGAFAERTMEEDMNLINVDIVTLTKMTKLFLKDMLRRKDGKILNVASTAALLPGPYQATYYAAKAYVLRMDEAIYEEINGSGVTITTLMPSGMNTGFAKAGKLEGTTLAKAMVFGPSQVARESYGAMLQGRMNIISGVTLLQRLAFKLFPFIPVRMKMRQILKMQQK